MQLLLLVLGAFISHSKSCGYSGQPSYYDAFRGEQLTQRQLNRHVTENTTFWCVSEIELPCREDEYRRIDGSCNNLRVPLRGTSKTPFSRFLPASHDEGYKPRRSKDGSELPLPRHLRTQFLSEGKSTGALTQNAANFLVFAISDTVDNHDTVNYVLWRPYCCRPEGRSDPMCAPNPVPEDDPVHRFSGISCINMTRPITFQSSGCIENNTVPERLMTSTTLVDLSVVYGNDQEKFDEKARLFKGGLLKYEVDDLGRIWPPSAKGSLTECLLNKKPHETRCHDGPNQGANSLMGINVIFIWFWRNHNKIALELARVNPSWDDEKLLNVARDINVATYLQIYYYELIPLIYGRENVLKSGVTSPSQLHRDIYDEKVLPQMTLEFPGITRWFHLIQEGTYRLYTKEGVPYDEIPIVNLTMRTGYLQKNIEGFTQGLFRQAGAGVDYVVDPDISELGLGGLQRMLDITANDLSKNRLFGFAPYVKYLEKCRGNRFRSFEDVAEVIDPERIELLRSNYKYVEDIDLVAGTWLEKILPGSFVPPTLYCLAVDQFLRTIVSDRHWYERKNRPHAFTEEQLLEIRKASLARLMCDNADSVSEIQPRAFELISPQNPITNCRQLTAIDYGKWRNAK